MPCSTAPPRQTTYDTTGHVNQREHEIHEQRNPGRELRDIDRHDADDGNEDAEATGEIRILGSSRGATVDLVRDLGGCEIEDDDGQDKLWDDNLLATDLGTYLETP